MMTAEQLAQFFHESYERLAPQFGYETRKESAKPWANVPEQNRKLMTAVCAEVLTQAAAQLAEKEREIARLNAKLEAEEDDAKILEARAEAAEQRLQEAQGQLGRKNVEIERLQDGWTKTVADKHLLIAKLGQREAELEQRWIALGERLPELGIAVLALSGGSISVMSRDFIGQEEGWLWSEQHWAWNLADPDGFECDDDYQPTHWQPLPSPPKEAKS